MCFVDFCFVVQRLIVKTSPEVHITINDLTFSFHFVSPRSPDPTLDFALYPLQSMIISYFES